MDIETWNTAVENAANICERMIIGGRAWTEDQAKAAEVLEAAAKNVRALKAPELWKTIGLQITQ